MMRGARSAPQWETLVRVPLPPDAEPVISVNGLTMPAQPVGEHSHAGPTIGYIAKGEIENQVAPDPATILKPGGHFYEAPRQVHKMMRNLSVEPAKLLVFHAGRTGVPAALVKSLQGDTKLSFSEITQWQVPLASTAHQELRLLRLTLPVGVSHGGGRALGPRHDPSAHVGHHHRIRRTCEGQDTAFPGRQRGSNRADRS
jgi:quercetin dioxygenase-like cupin family protein